MSKLDTVSKLLAKAENAGTPEEAEAFMEGAQRIATQNGVDLAVARMHQAKKERAEEPEERSVQINPYNRKRNRKQFIELAMHVADVNDLQYLIGGGDYKLFVVGFPSDIDVFEAMYIHLAHQMVSQCDAALKAGANRQMRTEQKMRREPIPTDEIEWGEWNDSQNGWYNDLPGYPLGHWNDPPKWRLVPVLDDDGNPVYVRKSVSVVDGRVFRGDFYDAFASRIWAKLWGAKRKAMAEAGAEVEDSATALAVRDKQAEVNKAHAEQRAKVVHLGEYKHSSEGRTRYDHTGAARELGTKAAEATSVHGERGVDYRKRELG